MSTFLKALKINTDECHNNIDTKVIAKPSQSLLNLIKNSKKKKKKKKIKISFNEGVLNGSKDDLDIVYESGVPGVSSKTGAKKLSI